MPSFNVVKDIRAGFGPCQVVAAIYTFALEHSEEALASGIIGAATNRTHAADQVVTSKEPLVFSTGELTTAIRVQYNLRVALALP